MKLLYCLFVLSLCVIFCFATEEYSSFVGGRRACRRPAIRKEWRTMSRNEKRKYIEAVKCLTTKPTRAGLNGTVNLFDDFQAVHSQQTPNIHFVGFFAIWHRYFVAAYEKALRDDCGYRGGQPYWDWTLDTKPGVDFRNSPVLDPITGFGGNGPWVEDPPNNWFQIPSRSGGGCVLNGPFVYPNFILHVGPGEYNNTATPNPHCLTRDFAPTIMNWCNSTNVALVMSQPDYTSFAKQLENIPSFAEPTIHGGGHFGIGGLLGTMGDRFNSPGDPIFYLHHGNLDRLYWEWQKKDLHTRLRQVGGPVNPFDYSGVNVTLDFEIHLGRLGASKPLKKLLNIKGDTLCYDYR